MIFEIQRNLCNRNCQLRILQKNLQVEYLNIFKCEEGLWMLKSRIT